MLIHFIKLARTVQDEWAVDPPDKNESIETLARLGFFKAFSDCYPSTDLFNHELIAGSSSQPVNQIRSPSNQTSFPIFQLKFGTPHRRDGLKRFKRYLMQTLEPLENEFDFPLIPLVTLLHELGKNSADHTNGDAFFGLDFLTDPQRQKLCLNFAFADLGVGIKQNVEESGLLSDSRHEHLGFSDAYHHALTYGWTTKPNSKSNHGIGMTVIRDQAREIGLNLSVFDANSRALLSNMTTTSHKELRKHFYSTGRSVGFYYFGTLCLNAS